MIAYRYDISTVTGLGRLVSKILFVFVLAASMSHAAESLKVTVYGASGSIGSRIVDEALMRGHDVTGVSRSADRLAGKHDGLRIEEGNVVDRGSVLQTVAGQDVVIIAINDDRDITEPAEHAVNRAAVATVDALTELGADAPRVIQVIGAATLEVRPGVQMIDTMELEPGSGPYILISGHKLAWDHYHANPDVSWTLVSPSRYIEPGERTGTFRVGGVVALRNDEGKLSNISIEDFAVAILDEVENKNYINQQFNVGY